MLDDFFYEKRMDFDSGVFRISDPNFNFGDLKTFGFIYSESRGEWSTPDLSCAFTQYKFATARSRIVLGRYFIIERPVDTTRFDWPGGLNPHDFQLAAANFSLARNRSYLALDPGMGKTIIAALIYNHSPGRTLAVVPSALKYNWKKEFLKWNTTKLSENDIVTVESTEHAKNIDPKSPFVIMPDSLTDSAQAMDAVCALRYDWLFVDEAHRYKTPDSKRTHAVYGGFKKWKGGTKYIRGIEASCSRVVSLSGTPWPNRPFEIWPVLYSQAPATIDFKNSFQFGIRYCAGFHDGYGMNFKGASNLSELHGKVFNKFMIQMKKEDYLLGLPEKTREIVFIDANIRPQTKAFSRDVLSKYSIGELLSNATGGKVDLGEIAMARQDLGESKIDPAVKFISEILDNTNEKIVVFAHHKVVVHGLHLQLKKYGAMKIDGSMTPLEKDGVVKAFQTDEEKRVAVVSIHAGGVGTTLTRGRRAIFVEYDWVPGNNVQAEDRLHRITQKDNVFCQYLVVEHTLDQAVLEVVMDKMEVINELTTATP